MSKKIKTGVLSEDELLLFYDYFKSNIDDNQYVIEVTNSRAAEAKYTQHEWLTKMVKTGLFLNYFWKQISKYQRIKRKAVRSFEVKKIST